MRQNRPHPEGFPKADRLCKRREFLGVSASGRKYHTPHLILLCLPNDIGHPRLGITVSRKVGIAVTRNRVKRLIREFYRHNKYLFTAADYSIIAKQGAGIITPDTLGKEITRAITALKTS